MQICAVDQPRPQAFCHGYEKRGDEAELKLNHALTLAHIHHKRRGTPMVADNTTSLNEKCIHKYTVGLYVP